MVGLQDWVKINNTPLESNRNGVVVGLQDWVKINSWLWFNANRLVVVGLQDWVKINAIKLVTWLVELWLAYKTG